MRTPYLGSSVFTSLFVPFLLLSPSVSAAVARLEATPSPLDAQLRVRVSGAPREGARMQLIVRGAPFESFVLRIDALSSEAQRDSNSEWPSGAQVASASDSEPAIASRLIAGTLDAAGIWRRSFIAPHAGTRIRFAAASSSTSKPPRSNSVVVTLQTAPMTMLAQNATPVTGIVESSASTAPPLEDRPDELGLDTNGDGIDGDISRAYFVSPNGSPANPGTLAQPLDDIDQALQLAALDPARDQVYVAFGTYVGPIHLVDGVSLYGGYDDTNGWQRAPQFDATIVSTPSSASNDATLVADQLSNTIFVAGFDVAAGAPSSVLGQNRYAVVVRDCSKVVFEDVRMFASDAGDGVNGASGAQGQFGSSGVPSSGNGGGPGGSGAAAGGAGGPGGTASHTAGFNGGGGVGPGGNGGSAGAWNGSGGTGQSGGSGSSGTAGAPTANVGAIVSGWWSSNAFGGNGTNGSNGGGGGGGGGSGAGLLLQNGNGGGGGGAGGLGGHAGFGGAPGGSSIGLLVVNSGVKLIACDVGGGNGGRGGFGGSGGTGGSGGSGAPGHSSGSAPNGGNGGHGGSGGLGGAGAGGGGGNSFGIALDATSSLKSVNSTVGFATPGAGGSSPAGSGSAGFAGTAQAIKQL